ncbi:MAG: hypothetical protein AAF617_03450 [Bacteroidota bacterium]
MKKLFRESIRQKSRKKILQLSNPWVTDNTDNFYVKTDTVRLINPKKQYQLDFCQEVNWSFFRSDSFYMVESQSCKEPTSAKVSKPSDRHEVKIKKTAAGLTLTLRNIYGIADRFLVISIEQNEQFDAILLKRLRY